MASREAHKERVRNQEIVNEFFIKSLQVILESRIPNFRVQEGGGGLLASSSSSVSRLKARQKWFNLVLSDSPKASEITEPWRADTSQPLVIDVLLLQPKVTDRNVASGVPRETASSRTSSTKHEHLQDALVGGETADRTPAETVNAEKIVLERWIIWYDDQGTSVIPDNVAKKLGKFGGNDMKGGYMPANTPPKLALDLPTVYKKCVIFFRTLYCTVRALPAHHLFRLANSPSEVCKFSLDFVVSKAPISVLQAENLAMTPKSFVPVELQRGKIHMSVAYRRAAAVSALEINYPVQPRIIPDYVGSPTTDPLRRFTGYFQTGSVPTGVSGRQFHGVSVLSGTSDSSPVPYFERPHSWSEGKMQPVSQKPSSYSTSSFPFGDFKANFQKPEQCSTPTRPPIHSQPLSTLQYTQGDARSFSRQSMTRFCSSSCSPRATFDSEGHPFKGPSSAPVRMQMQGVPNKETSIRPTRALLPPLSPQRRSIKSSPQHSSKSGLRIEQIQHRLGPPFERNTSDYASTLNAAEHTPPHFVPKPFNLHKGTLDERIEEKLSSHATHLDPFRPVQASSRSACKSSTEENLEEEFVFPFALDISEKDEFRGRNEAYGLPQPMHRSTRTSPESEAAAVGVLVRILKSATPLRESAIVSAISSPQHENPNWFQVKKALARVPSKPGSLGRTGLPASASNRLLMDEVKSFQGEGMLQKTAHDALEELRGYRELKEFLEKQSGQSSQ